MAKGVVKMNRNSFPLRGVPVYAGDIVEMEINGKEKMVEILSIFEGRHLYLISAKDGHKNLYIERINK